MLLRNLVIKYTCWVFTLVFSSLIQAKTVNIATVSPISHSLTQAMVEGTPINVSYIPPIRLPVNRIASWVQKHRSDTFEAYDAVVGISSVYTGLDIYPSLRQSNIRIVNIDIAHAIMPNGEKVVLVDNDEYFWLNNNNMLVMSGILKRDLIALWPQFSNQLNKNYQKITQLLRSRNLQVDQLLMENDIAFVVPRNKKLTPLLASLSSDVGTETFARELGLRFITVSATRLTERSPIWVIDDFSRYKTLSLTARLSGQVEELETLLQHLD